MRIYTLGYEGLGLSSYISILRNFNVGVVLDVRERAWSQSPQFVKSALHHALASAGIGYVHIPSAGNPSEIRKNVRSTKECMRRFRVHLNAHPECLREIYGLARAAAQAGRPACLTCVERLPGNCHRGILIEALIERYKKIEPVHLPLESPIDLRKSTPNHGRTVSLQRSAFLDHDLLPVN